ncbi:MAG TPA: PEP-CTERM sorting domain-containing protein [Kamptonema sp.]|nr:PEP-CTERM sorting domain-containing protein [Kamptonema sp.]
MYKTIRWLLISTALLVGASAIASFPANAFERDSNSRQQTPVSFELAQANVQQDRTPTSDISSYNFSINYSDSSDTINLENNQISDIQDSTWTQNSIRDNTTGTVSIPEPSTLLGLIGVSFMFTLKRKISSQVD